MTFKRVFTRRLVWLIHVCAAIGIGALSPCPARAQTEETRYFEETGHNVRGEFLRFYEANGGRAIFGYPLTDAFEEDGRQVQYFQRARLELDPGPQRVQLGALGLELGYDQPPLAPSEALPSSHPDKRYYPETGHTVAFAFLEFYEANGGPGLFGYPITEWIIESNGRIVQYFERGKLEWYPENPPGQRVQPGMLGVIYVEQYVDPIYTERQPFSRSPEEASTPGSLPDPQPVLSVVTDLQVLATVKHPIIGLRGEQTIYVYVLDQESQGVEGASVEITIQYENGRVEDLSVESTDANGYGQIDFRIGDAAPGYVVIASLSARYADLEARTTSAFLPWW